MLLISRRRPLLRFHKHEPVMTRFRLISITPLNGLALSEFKRPPSALKQKPVHFNAVTTRSCCDNTARHSAEEKSTLWCSALNHFRYAILVSFPLRYSQSVRTTFHLRRINTPCHPTPPPTQLQPLHFQHVWQGHTTTAASLSTCLARVTHHSAKEISTLRYSALNHVRFAILVIPLPLYTKSICTPSTCHTLLPDRTVASQQHAAVYQVNDTSIKYKYVA